MKRDDDNDVEEVARELVFEPETRNYGRSKISS